MTIRFHRPGPAPSPAHNFAERPGATAKEDEVAEIFVRINSEGVQLNQADFILTLMSVHWEKGRRELEAFSQASIDPTITGPSSKNPFLEPGPDQLLRVGVALAFRRARLQHVYSILGERTSTPAA